MQDKSEKGTKSTQEQLSDVLNPKQQKDLTTIMQFKPSNDSKKVQETADGLPTAIQPDSDDENSNIVKKMRRELYQIPDHLDVDKIKSSRQACFADRTAVHIKNGLTEV